MSILLARRRCGILPVVLLTLSAWTSVAAGQELTSEGATGPRFLLASATTGQRVEVEASAVPLLRRRVSLTLDGATVAGALKAIGTRAEVSFIYDPRLTASERRIRLHADGLTVAAALTEVLFDSGLDVLVSDQRHLAIVPRHVVAPDSGSVAGRVTDKTTGAAIVGAMVMVERTSSTATTDNDGRYRFPRLEVGKYTLRTRYIGYAPGAASVTVSADQETTVDFALERSAQQLSEVVTTGTVVPTEVKGLPTPVDVVTAADIERQQLRRTDQIFRLFVPSAVAWDLGENPEQTAITIRGASSFSGGTGVKIFVDGIEVTSTTFTLIDPSSIERVEIIRGPQAATIYGPGAIGGVMQVFTKKGDPALARPQLEAEASAGLLESAFERGGTLRQHYEGAVRGGGGAFGYNVGGTYDQTGEWIPEFHLRQPSIYGSGTFTQGPVTIDLTSRYFVTDQNIPNPPRLVRAGLESPLPRHEERHYRQSTYGAHLGYAPTTWWRHNLTVGIDGFSGSQFNTRPRLLTPDDTLVAATERENAKRSIAYNTSVTAPLTAAVSASVTAGFDHFVIDDDIFAAPLAGNFEGVITPDPAVPITVIRGPTRNTGYFAQTQLGVRDALFLTAGLRVDKNTVLGDEHPVSPRVGIAYNWPLAGGVLKARAAYGEAIRAPQSLSRLGFDLGLGRFLPNLDLRAERQKGADGGIDFVWGTGSVSVTYYRQTAADLIQTALLEVDTAGVVVFQDQNTGRVRNTGLELQTALRFGSAQVTGNYAYTSSKVLELAPGYVGELLPGDYVLEIPRHTAGVTVAVTHLRNTTVSSGLTYVGKRTSYDYVALLSGTAPRDAWITYDPFVKLNLSVTQALTPGISALLTVENLTDNDTGEQFDYLPSVGRTTSIGLRARW